MKKSYMLICVIALSLAVSGCDQTTATETTQTPTYTQREWTPVYNDHVCGIMASWADSECASRVELTTEEILSVLPGKQLEDVTYTGKADLRRDGSVLRLRIWAEKGDAEAFIAIGSDSYRFACCISRESDAKISLCGDLQYKIYRKDDALFAEAVCNEYPMLIFARADVRTVDAGETGTLKEFVKEDIELDRLLFEEILECFSWYEKDKPNLGVFTPSGSD